MPFESDKSRPSWPRRAVVTAGMPYGNKSLHFGHIGGVFIPADMFARFLRDRIGAQNVRFVSGTDCFGSPIDEGYRKLVEAGEFEGTISDYVQGNHLRQKATLDAYDISLDIFEGSGIGHCGEVHQAMTNQFITALFENGWLSRIDTLQFYDTEAQTFLNGRQVVGRCPVQGCKSERAYADECDFGHQYAPEDLIAPKSTVTGVVPDMRPVENWYFDLPAFSSYLSKLTDGLEADKEIRAIVAQTIREFLVPPIVYIKNDLYDSYVQIADKLPKHVYREAQGGKQSFELEFATIGDRDEARPVLGEAGIRYRTGKALVPFRLTGNIEWGVKAPVMDDVEGLTVWCWPESLWAPISFTIAANDALGLPRETWRDFWCSEDACVYQFIGQDNLYFYGVAQPALFHAVQACRDGSVAAGRADGTGIDGEGTLSLRQTRLVANHHVLFGKKKASSSSAVKPPSADQLLDCYTCEQLRAHFLALGLDQKSVGFSPKAFDPDEEKRNDSRVADPALKEGALLANVFNRLARSCFYEAQKNFGSVMPIGQVTPGLVEESHKALVTFETLMHRADLHTALSCADAYIRSANKYWADGIRDAEQAGDNEARRQVLLDSAYQLWISAVLMHSVVPSGCELICQRLGFDATDFFSWNRSFVSLEELCPDEECEVGGHRFEGLPPRFDFFKKHPSQY